MIKTKDIKNFKHISDPTEEKLNNLKLVSQDTNKDVVSIQGELTKDILKARSLERLDTIEADSSVLDDKIGEIETSVAEELTEITDRTETVISNSKKYKQDIEAFLSVAKGDDFIFFLDDCTRAVGRLDKLTDGSNLCHSKKITSWDIPLPALTKGGDSNSGMFQNCTALTSFSEDIPVLTNGYYMFQNCTALTSFMVDLPVLTNGSWMFNSCTSFTNFTKDFPVLTNGESMFGYCEALQSYTGDLPAITNGSYMFYRCTSLTSFTVNLPTLIDGSGMFGGCTSLTSFTSDIPALTNGAGMFSGCTSLTSFTVDLPALTNGKSMFSSSTSLTSFTSGIPALTMGDWMFRDCTSLTSFMGDLSVLTDGNYMFAKCKLDLASVQNIANTINNLAAQSKTNRIIIGMAAELNGNTELRTALTTIRNKGWTVTEQYN